MANPRSGLAVLLLGMCVAGGAAQATMAGEASALKGKVPVTTSSKAALAEFLSGRNLLERLRATDARAHFAKAAELDPGFALAYYNLANTAPDANEFFAALRKAVALSDKASAGEAHMIRALEAGVNGRPDDARRELEALVAEFPDDERAHTLLGNLFFARQDWTTAIGEYRKATAINPEFSQTYNQLGYALRSLERYGEAEEAFKSYVKLIPGEPNPYDSYAELLMKTGRFDESIAQYKKALEIDANFIASYVGIANDDIFLGRPDEARKVLAKLESVARNDGERRQAHLWAAVSYIHEGDTSGALGEVERQLEIAKRSNDRVAMSGDLNLMGNILLEAGKLDAAGAKFEESAAAIDAADATPDTKEATHRNHLYDVARVALARKDLAAAVASAEKYRQQVEVRKIPFEVRRNHEIAGLIALAKGDGKAAAAELEQANQQDPRVLVALGEAYALAGRAEEARRTFKRAAEFNGLAINYAFVRAKAKAKLAG